jgi:hypothetical protein
MAIFTSLSRIVSRLCKSDILLQLYSPQRMSCVKSVTILRPRILSEDDLMPYCLARF